MKLPPPRFDAREPSAAHDLCAEGSRWTPILPQCATVRRRMFELPPTTATERAALTRPDADADQIALAAALLALALEGMR